MTTTPLPAARRDPRTTRRGSVHAARAVGVVTLLAVSGCATTTSTTPAADHVVRVVAAENFWGSLAAQLGGSHAQVSSVISNPDTDPHSYEPTAADARKVTTAQFVIVNGIGYDAWADRLLGTDPGKGRTELKVGDLLGIRPGGNPHRWYSPDDVHRVIEQTTADYQRLDPADAAYFDQRKQQFETVALAPYQHLIDTIRSTYAGTPIGASESIVTPLASGLGLNLLTPESFLDAMSEGSDPTAADKSAIDRQIRGHRIKVYVYNSQNATPDIAAQVALVRSEGIPVATVTETLSPATDTFQQWQVRELQGLQAALAEATGK